MAKVAVIIPTSSLIIPVAPVPAARPRVSKFGTHYPKTYAAYRKLAHTWAAKQEWSPIAGKLRVHMVAVANKPRTSKLQFPHADVDNYAKAALDVLNGNAWVDDIQIISLTVDKRFALVGEEPHTALALWELTPEQIEEYVTPRRYQFGNFY